MTRSGERASRGRVVRGPVAVLLAAGESRRMRGLNKLLLTIDGVALVRRQVDTLVAAGLAQVVVVLGHQAQRVEPLLPREGVIVVRHAGYALGQQGSVLAGLAALPADADPVLVVLGDLPLLEAADVRALLSAWAARPTGCRILVPWHDGQRGNPVVVDAWVVREVLARGDTAGGLRGYIDANRQAVARFDATSDHYTCDLDTPEDIERLERRIGRRIGGWRGDDLAAGQATEPGEPGSRGD